MPICSAKKGYIEEIGREMPTMRKKVPGMSGSRTQDFNVEANFRLTNQLTGDNMVMARKVFEQINVDYLAIMRR